MAASKDPNKRDNKANARAMRDHAVLADPDVRGTRAWRRGQNDDERTATGNSPERVERMWNREGRG